ncbi:MAG: DNA polymerase III subunit delta [Candidatus Epulonipiscioides saccharophilum]|nr:MAG: DNA polymerase III subunit delta [Epulopiscium sp. AS2M-Bin001]
MIYLVYGTEIYLKNRRIAEIKSQNSISNSLMNEVVIKGKTGRVETIIEEGETHPFLSDKKIIIVKDSELFVAGRKDDSNKLAKWLESAPEYVYLIFDESKIDKGNRLFKTLRSFGQVEEFNMASDVQIASIIKAEFNNPNVDHRVLQYFISKMPNDITYILLEFSKLLSYCGAEPISISAIDEICVVALEQQIFGLIKYIFNQDTTTAINFYHELIYKKESPIAMLGLIASNYRNIFQIKDLARLNHPSRDIANKLGLRDFVVKDYINVSKRYKYQEIKDALKLCLDTDKNIKTGLVEAEKGVELLIFRLCIKNSTIA